MIATKYSTVSDYISVIAPYFGDFADEFDLDAIARDMLEWDERGYFVERKDVALDDVVIAHAPRDFEEAAR